MGAIKGHRIEVTGHPTGAGGAGAFIAVGSGTEADPLLGIGLGVMVEGLGFPEGDGFLRREVAEVLDKHVVSAKVELKILYKEFGQGLTFTPSVFPR